MNVTELSIAKLPTDPQPPEKAGFPLVTCIAPLVMGCVLFAVTRSPMMLLFVLLSPALAIASTVDQRIRRRRAERRRKRERSAQIEACRESVRASHRAEREAAWQRTGSLCEVVSGNARIPHTQNGWLWLAGSGTVPSECALGRERGMTSRDAVAVIQEASRVEEMPVRIPVREGLRITGNGAGVEALARSVIVQALAALPTAVLERSAAELCGVAVDDLLPVVDMVQPHIRVIECHRSEEGEAEILLGFEGKDVDAVAVPTVSIELSRGILTGAEETRTFRPALVSRQIAKRRAMDRLAAMAAAADREPPQTYALERAGATESTQVPGGSLVATCASDARGPVAFDLVTDGPHAAVGGTTGSGKSEFLRSWALSLADRYTPEECALLLIDFKGGATFDDLAALPHTAGILTDLDEAEIIRAIESLRAELRHREQILRDYGAPGIDRIPLRVMPRLVIMVDEFQAMLAEHPDLHRTFVDIAARGRSLGVHLVLCTQRPAAAARDALLANCSLRISLRVNNAADSRSLLDDDAAASISRTLPGRLCFTMLDGVVHQAQGAYAVDVAEGIVRDARATHDRVSQVWLPRLAAGMPTPPPAVNPTVAWLDIPSERRREAVTVGGRFGRAYFATGGTASGLTTLGRALMAQLVTTTAPGIPSSDDEKAPGGRWLDPGSGPAESWAALGRLHGEISDLPPGSIVVIDDVDESVRSLPLEYQDAALDRLADIVTRARRMPVGLVMTSHRASGGMTPLAAKCDTIVRLRTPSKADFIISGGDGAIFDEHWPVGGGAIGAHRMQTPFAPVGVEAMYRISARAPEVVLTGGVALVTSRAGTRRRAIEHSGLREVTVEEVFQRTASGANGALIASDEIAVGSPTEWGAKWGLIGKLRARHVVVVDGCTATDLRTHLGESSLPPLLDSSRGEVWELRPDSPTERKLWGWRNEP